MHRLPSLVWNLHFVLSIDKDIGLDIILPRFLVVAQEIGRINSATDKPVKAIR